MKLIRPILTCAAFLLAVTLGPQVALASGPSTSPALIHHEGFESSSMPSLTLDWALIPAYVPEAYWGRITQRHAPGGSYGLWCAGSTPTSEAPNPSNWLARVGKYNNTTAGLATFDLPLLADYYSASLDYLYTMPSLGADDGDALNVLWYSSADVGYKDYHVAQPLTATNEWVRRSWDLSATGGRVNLSRTDGKVQFNFVDSSGVFESPQNGEGATIDEILVQGFKFGPVRSLTATVTAGHVVLTWQTPWRSTAAIAPEERPVAYRVWRSPDTSPTVWTELTSSRISAATFDDATPPTGYSRYAVQAWDPGTGTGYGQISLPDDAVRIGVGLVPPTTSCTVLPASPGASGWHTATPTVTIKRDLAGWTYFGSGPASSTWDSTSTLDWSVTVSQGDVTYGYFGVGSTNNTETLVHSVRIKLDTVVPVTDSSAVETYTAPATITLTRSDHTPGSGLAGTRFSIDGAAATSGTVASTSALGLRTLTFSSVDVAGNREATKTATFTVSAPPAATVSRVGGKDRFAVAAALARLAFPNWQSAPSVPVTTVIVASGVDAAAADPLGAAGLCGAARAPLLLVNSLSALPAATVTALRDIAAGNRGVKPAIIVVGGPASVSAAHVSALRPYSSSIKRLSGADRYAVAASVAYEIRRRNGGANPPFVLIAAGNSPARFFEPLALGAIAAANKVPVLLVNGSTVPPVTLAAAGALAAPGDRYLGAHVSIVSESARARLGGGPRIPGVSAERTVFATAVATYALSRDWLVVGTAGVTNKLADALGGGAAMGLLRGPVLYTSPTGSLATSTRSFITTNKAGIARVHAIGGPASVPESTLTRIRAIWP